MTPEERTRLDQLCALIKQEQDPKKFEEYIRELNDLLDEKRERIRPGCE